MAVHFYLWVIMSFSLENTNISGHGYHSDVVAFHDIYGFAAPFLCITGPGFFSFNKFTNLLFLRIYMFVKELKNECKNYQWRRNRQDHP